MGVKILFNKLIKKIDITTFCYLSYIFYIIMKLCVLMFYLVKICYSRCTYNISGWCPGGSICGQNSGACSSFCEKGCEFFSPTPNIYPYTTICLNTSISKPEIGYDSYNKSYAILNCPFGQFNDYLNIVNKYVACSTPSDRDIICYESIGNGGICIKLLIKLLDLVSNITCKFNDITKQCNIYSCIECN